VKESTRSTQLMSILIGLLLVKKCIEASWKRKFDRARIFAVITPDRKVPNQRVLSKPAAGCVGSG
jgi:hypothetical protein